MEGSFRGRSSRAAFITAATVAGTGLVLNSVRTEGTGAATAGSCSESIATVIDTLLLAEHLATTFYYKGLTAPEVMRDSLLGGSSTQPLNPGLPPDGNPPHVRYLQAALDAETKHAALLAQAGATTRARRFYFPAFTFRTMGRSTDADSFLGVLDLLETTLVGMYIAAANQFVQGGRHDLAALATAIMGVESEHRMLGRVIAGMMPANNLTLQKQPFACASDAGAVLRPFLTGKGFATGATHAIALPSRAQAAHVVGKYGTHHVLRFM